MAPPGRRKTHRWNQWSYSAWRNPARQVRNCEDFVSFVRALLADLKKNPDAWENRNLDSFLDALAAWVEDMDGYYLNAGGPVPEQPTWKTLADMLLAARIYE